MTQNAMLQFRWLPLAVTALIFGGPLPAGASGNEAAHGMDGKVAGVVLDADEQPPTPTSFDALSAILETGHEVIVTDDGGRRTRGRVSSISSSQLVLVRKRFRFSRPETRSFAGESITRIRIVDPTRNGGMLGAAAAVGLLAALIERDCSSGCVDNFGRPGRWVVEARFSSRSAGVWAGGSTR